MFTMPNSSAAGSERWWMNTVKKSQHLRGGSLMEFNERTIKVIIDDEKCEGCKTHACVEACKTYSRGILVLKDGKPTVEGSPEELARKGTECLACEYECWFRGNSAITIEVPIEGLADYRKKHGTD
jgi:hypothetical protein